MARVKNEDKRNAILEAATRLIVTYGLNAPTTMIAQEAGVANGTLFTYFETKTDLLNQLYLELKAGMASAALQRLPAEAELRGQVFHLWSNWMDWAVYNPEKRRTLAQLGLSEEITPATRAAAHEATIGLTEAMERMRAVGSLRNIPMDFAAAIMNSLAEATMDFMIRDPANAKEHCKDGFEALWRVVA